jgi:hypothetical protein
MSLAKGGTTPAIVAFLLIPVVFQAGVALFGAINPEWAAGHANYARNWQLIDLARKAIWFGSLAVCAMLWLATCWFLIRAKQRSVRWLAVALLGPLGLAILAALRDRRTDDQGTYDRFVGGLKWVPHLLYEVVSFVVLLVLAFYAVDLLREILIAIQVARTGLSHEQIVAIQDQDGGMYAFAEGLEALFFLVLFYLLRPILVNLYGTLRDTRRR